MKKVAVLIYDDAVLVAVSGVLDLLIGTNRLLREGGKHPFFDVELVGVRETRVQLHQPALFQCHRTVNEVGQTDLVIVPSFIGQPLLISERYAKAVSWIRKMYERGSEVASLCRGSYFLAEAGLLKGRTCTSHWNAVDDMVDRYPEIEMMPDQIITDQDGVYTSGGAFSSIHVVLYLIEKYCGKEVAIQISKIYSLDYGRISQAHFAIFSGQRNHEDVKVHQVQDWIEENYGGQIRISQIASRFHMSKRTFIRRFKRATRNTPLEYIQRVRVEAFKKGLERGGKPVGSLVYDVGYRDEKSFRGIFKRYTGLTPREYRSRYSRTATG